MLYEHAHLFGNRILIIRKFPNSKILKPRVARVNVLSPRNVQPVRIRFMLRKSAEIIRIKVHHGRGEKFAFFFAFDKITRVPLFSIMLTLCQVGQRLISRIRA